MPKTKIKTHRTTKLSIRTAGRQNVQVQVVADDRTLANIAACRESYLGILGHDVSTSLIVRRAVAMLAQYLRSVRGEDHEADELSFLMRHVR